MKHLSKTIAVCIGLAMLVSACGSEAEWNVLQNMSAQSTSTSAGIQNGGVVTGDTAAMPELEADAVVQDIYNPCWPDPCNGNGTCHKPPYDFPYLIDYAEKLEVSINLGLQTHSADGGDRGAGHQDDYIEIPIWDAETARISMTEDGGEDEYMETVDIPILSASTALAEYSGADENKSTVNQGFVCRCDRGYAGDYCEQCARGYIGYPYCIPDNCTEEYCGEHGVCDPVDGGCLCDEGYTGARCRLLTHTDEIGIDWVELWGTGYAMGCSFGDEDCQDTEKPLHRVRLKPFAIMATEVTVGQWLRVWWPEGDHPVGIEALNRNCNEPPSGALKVPQCKACGQHPVTSDFGMYGRYCYLPDPTYENAEAFCRLVGGRLPSEAQWEYAARGGSFSRYPVPLRFSAWYFDNSGYWRFNDDYYYLYYTGQQKHNVALLYPNNFGLYDMIGNVAEIVADDWHDNYNGAPYNGSVWENDEYDIFLLGVIRGGSYDYAEEDVRVSVRREWVHDWYGADVGFRCVKDVPCNAHGRLDEYGECQCETSWVGSTCNIRVLQAGPVQHLDSQFLESLDP